MTSENHVVTGRSRLSYVHLLQPYANRNSGEEKYSVTVLVPKSDVATKQRIDAAIEAASQNGVKLWGGRPPKVANPVYDGDGVRPSDGLPFSEECKGHWVFTASCKKDRPPRIVDLNLQDILEPREIFSGIFGRVGVDFFPYSQAGKKGVGCGLTNVQKLADGEPLGNRTTPEDDFGAAPAQPPYAAPAQPQYAAPAQPQYAALAQPQYVPPGYGAVQPQYAPAGYGQTQRPFDPLTGLPI